MELLNEKLEYSKFEEKYLDHLYDQYKVYVEMADRISQRRSQANTFFLGLNTIVATGFSIFAENHESIEISSRMSYIILAILLSEIIAWIAMLRSYRNLNTAKFKVIGEFEKFLPASPFWNAEWEMLGRGKDYKKYLPLSLVETVIPGLFGVIYILILL